MKCGRVDGSVSNGLMQAIFFSFVLDQPAGNKFSCEPETIYFKKVKNSVWNIITFYLQDINHEEVNFNGETLTFTLQIIGI